MALRHVGHPSSDTARFQLSELPLHRRLESVSIHPHGRQHVLANQHEAAVRRARGGLAKNFLVRSGQLAAFVRLAMIRLMLRRLSSNL